MLLLKGRLTLVDLARFSRFKTKHVRECLVVLIQHGVVYFSEPTADSTKADAPTFYEIDPKKILMRLRMGRIMRISEEHYGKPVGSVYVGIGIQADKYIGICYMQAVVLVWKSTIEPSIGVGKDQ